MPIYEYKCQKCEHNFESLQKIADEPLKICPQCGANQLVKLISNTSFQLKGTGWYVTDFKNNTKNQENKKPTESPKKPEKTEPKTTEK